MHVTSSEAPCTATGEIVKNKEDTVMCRYGCGLWRVRDCW